MLWLVLVLSRLTIPTLSHTSDSNNNPGQHFLVPGALVIMCYDQTLCSLQPAKMSFYSEKGKNRI